VTSLSNTPSAPASETAEPPADDRAFPPPSRLAVWLKTRAAWIFLFDVVLVVVFSIISPNHVYATTANVTNVLLALTEALLLGLGLTMMLGAGIFDLSLGANLVLSSVVGAKVMLLFHPGSNVGLVIAVGAIACLATGLLYGLINGLIIAVVGINSLIATLATLGIGTGIADLITGGTDLQGLPSQLQTAIGLRTFGAVPLVSVIALAALVILWLFVRYTRYGLRVQAIGSSRAAAERAGLRVRSYLISLTVLAGGLAGIAGFIDLTRFGATSLAGHPNDALNAVTAAVIGGTLLEGGFISVIGTLWGACLAVILETGLVISGVSAFWQLIVVGVVLLVAVALDRFTVRRRARARRLTPRNPGT
jgi:ribose transport system permease protein